MKSVVEYPKDHQISKEITPKICTRLGKCTYCPLINKINETKCSFTKQTYRCKNLPKHITCEIEDIIYQISCTKCQKVYVGETGRPFRRRMYEHIASVKNNSKTTPVSRHFFHWRSLTQTHEILSDKSGAKHNVKVQPHPGVEELSLVGFSSCTLFTQLASTNLCEILGISVITHSETGPFHFTFKIVSPSCSIYYEHMKILQTEPLNRRKPTRKRRYYWTTKSRDWEDWKQWITGHLDQQTRKAETKPLRNQILTGNQWTKTIKFKNIHDHQIGRKKLYKNFTNYTIIIRGWFLQ